MSRWLVALLFSLALPALAVSPPPGAKAPDVVLEDQRGQPFRLRDQEGSVVVLVAGDRAASGQCHAWGAALTGRYGEAVTIIGLADTRSVPFFLKSRVRRSFDRDKARVLLDWEGAAFDRYGFEPGAANLVVIDRSGVVRAVHVGGPERDRVRLLLREIDLILSE